MTPIEYLFLIVMATAVAAGTQWVVRQRQLRRLRDLAAQWQMHFSETDCFRLAPRISAKLPVPGAAAVRVTDLVYGLEDRCYRYLFRAEYTVGVLRTKSTVRRVGTFVEPRDACSLDAIEVTFAPQNLPFEEQYRHLHEASRAHG